MKKLIITLLTILLLTGTAFAAPFIVSDPSSEAIGYEYQVEHNGQLVPGVFPVQPDGSIKFDLAGSAAGVTVYRARYGITGALGIYWWTAWSLPSNPFDVPALGGSPKSVRLSEN